MKRVWLCLGILLLLAGALLETAFACTQARQKVGEVALPNSCAAGCKQYDVYLVWDSSSHALSWQYVSGACITCPQNGGVVLSCGD
jgi:hypothetical protein